VAEAHRRQGWKVIACSLDNATAVRLGKQVNAKAMSFRSLEMRLRLGMKIDRKTLILIDESSKAGLREWDVVASACEEAELRVIPVGDVKQSGAIECPGMLDLMLGHEDVPSAELRVVRRHRDPDNPKLPHPWLARASCTEADGAEREPVRPGYHDALYVGDAKQAIAVLQEEGALEIHDTREEAMVALVEKWHRRRGEYGLEARDTVLVVYGTNEDIDRVNALAQQKRIDAGEIGGPGVLAVDRSYRIYAGDVVMLRETALKPDRGGRGEGRPDPVENGTMGTVLRVDPALEQVTVAFDAPSGDPREVTIDLGRLRAEWQEQQALKEAGEPHEAVPSLRLSIAGHQFPLQGGTWWYTGSLWGDGRMRLEDAISGDARAKCVLDVHVDRESLGWEGTDTDRLERKAKQLSEIRHKLSSLVHEVVPGAEITPPYSNFEAAPTLPHQPQPERSQAARKEWRDPLRHHRRMLGAQRVAALERGAQALAPAVAKLGEEQLEAAAERAEESFTRLDPAAAYESLRIERDKPPVEAQLDNALEHAADLEAEAEAIRSPLRRRERANLQRAARAQLRQAARHEAELGKLRDREQELHANAHHLESWLDSEREALELGIAAERELAERWERGRSGGDGQRPPQRDGPEREAAAEVGVESGQAVDPGLDAGPGI
jgi:AAA domain